MAKSQVIDPDDPHRFDAENFIRTTYSLRYGAVVTEFPRRILAMFDECKRVICAAGVRDAREEFFSERYLDAPIERILGECSGAAVDRGAVFEVSTLASQTPCSSAAFVREIVAFGEAEGFAWSFFTATSRLHLLLSRLGVGPVYLGEALAARIEEAGLWGSYYETRPRVCAVAGSRARNLVGGGRTVDAAAA